MKNRGWEPNRWGGSDTVTRRGLLRWTCDEDGCREIIALDNYGACLWKIWLGSVGDSTPDAVFDAALVAAIESEDR